MKRIINTFLLLSFAIIAMAQTSFVVADKNGNSQLVQSLVFQQQQTADRFSWKSDGLATGDINDLLFIARAKAELATANTEDVTKMLEELSGTDLADAEAIAATLKSNPNVEEACTTDGNNLIIKNKDGGGKIFYPFYETGDLLLDDALEAKVSALLVRSKMKRANSSSLGRVAIFNFFHGHSRYNTQNRIVDYMKLAFDLSGYTTEFYGAYTMDGSDLFSLANLQKVVEYSHYYNAIIIMTHGGLDDKGQPCIATRDKVTGKLSDDDLAYYDEEDKAYYRMIHYREEFAGIDKKSIVYLGACDGAPKGGFGKSAYDMSVFPEKNQSTLIAWSGKNRIAQAHAYLLFHYMMYYQYSLVEALNALPQEDPHFPESSMKPSNYLPITYLLSYTEADRTNDATCDLTGYQDVTITKKGVSNPGIQFDVKVNTELHTKMRIYLVDLLGGESKLLDQRIINGNEKFNIIYDISNVPNGCYDIHVEIKGSNGNYKTIKPFQPKPKILSYGFREMYAVPSYPKDMTQKPTILDTSNQPTDEITLPVGTTKTFTIDAYSGHTFETPCLDKSVCDVSVSGNTLTVKGLKEGSTIFGVFDVQNRQMAVAEVTVTAGGGGGGDIVAYTSCPDDHHPHLIDLGLSSGTKWACCNVGAQKPEDYGGYFAWGETSEKTRYYWDTYTHCDGSSSTFHDIGKDIAGTQYDAATANWGSPWVMPNLEQMEELRNSSTSEWTTENGVNGQRFTGPNGASIFLPASGRRWYDDLSYAGSDGYYWSSTLDESGTDYAYGLYFSSGYVNTYGYYRYRGQGVRPVRKN